MTRIGCFLLCLVPVLFVGAMSIWEYCCHTDHLSVTTECLGAAVIGLATGNMLFKAWITRDIE